MDSFPSLCLTSMVCSVFHNIIVSSSSGEQARECTKTCIIGCVLCGVTLVPSLTNSKEHVSYVGLEVLFSNPLVEITKLAKDKAIILYLL